jgi:hypothetical protein
VDDQEIRTNEAVERVAGELHEKARALNHLTQGSPGVTEPAVAYTVLGNLAQTAFRLAQTAEQIDVFLTRELDAGRLGHDRGEDPAKTVTAAHNELARAAEKAAGLGETFRRATGAINAIHGLEPDDQPSLDGDEALTKLIEQHDAQVEQAREDFPSAIGDVLGSEGPGEQVPPELRSPPQLPHPRRER